MGSPPEVVGGTAATGGGEYSTGGAMVATGATGTSCKTVPRVICSFFTPCSRMLARCPTFASSTRRREISIATTRALIRFPSVARNPISVPTEIEPSSTLPVTTRPRPGMEKASSAVKRNRPSPFMFSLPFLDELSAFAISCQPI